ncbi:MAG: hypothetical protein WA170_10050, partial [Candidatus Acidiferrales bacterium]
MKPLHAMKIGRNTNSAARKIFPVIATRILATLRNSEALRRSQRVAAMKNVSDAIVIPRNTASYAISLEPGRYTRLNQSTKCIPTKAMEHKSKTPADHNLSENLVPKAAGNIPITISEMMTGPYKSPTMSGYQGSNMTRPGEHTRPRDANEKHAETPRERIDNSFFPKTRSKNLDVNSATATT